VLVLEEDIGLSDSLDVAEEALNLSVLIHVRDGSCLPQGSHGTSDLGPMAADRQTATVQVLHGPFNSKRHALVVATKHYNGG